jgi:hypothetical protein
VVLGIPHGACRGCRGRSRAWAEKPAKEPLIGEPFEFPAGEVCSFAVLVDTTDLKASLTTFSNGRSLLTTSGTERLTNSVSGESASVRLGGSIVTTPLANGDVRSSAHGRVLLFYLAGDVGGPALNLTMGRVVDIFDASAGVITSSELSGRRIDMCAQLS